MVGVNRGGVGTKHRKCFFHGTDLALVVRKVDNAIQRINRYPADSVVRFVNTYPLDRDLSGA